MKKLIILLIMILALSSRSFCNPINWSINIGKNYSNRYVSVTDDDRKTISRTSIGVDCFYKVNDNYSVGAGVFAAVDDAAISTVSFPVYGDILSGFTIIHEFPLALWDLKPKLDIGTGFYSMYYFKRNSATANDTNVLSDITWADMSVGLKFNIYSNYDLSIKIEPLLSSLLVYQSGSISVTLGANF
jgi:hypothetical protein